jgi:hypothetical protein
MQKGRTVTLHIVSSLDGFIAKKDNGSPGWRVLEASTKPVLEQRSFTKRKLKFCDTLSKHLSFDNRAGRLPVIPQERGDDFSQAANFYSRIFTFVRSSPFLVYDVAIADGVAHLGECPNVLCRIGPQDYQIGVHSFRDATGAAGILELSRWICRETLAARGILVAELGPKARI